MVYFKQMNNNNSIPFELEQQLKPLIGKDVVTRRQFIDACLLATDLVHANWKQRYSIAHALIELWHRHNNLLNDSSLTMTIDELKKLESPDTNHPDDGEIVRKPWRDLQYVIGGLSAQSNDYVTIYVTQENLDEIILQPLREKLSDYRPTIQATLLVAMQNYNFNEYPYETIDIEIFPMDFGISIFASTNERNISFQVCNPFRDLPRDLRNGLVGAEPLRRYDYNDGLEIEEPVFKILSDFFEDVLSSINLRTLNLLPVYIGLHDDESFLLIEA